MPPTCLLCLSECHPLAPSKVRWLPCFPVWGRFYPSAGFGAHPVAKFCGGYCLCMAFDAHVWCGGVSPPGTCATYGCQAWLWGGGGGWVHDIVGARILIRPGLFRLAQSLAPNLVAFGFPMAAQLGLSGGRTSTGRACHGRYHRRHIC
jgi:hypothetical protein